MARNDRPKFNLGRLDGGRGPAQLISQRRAEEMVDAAFAKASAPVIVLPSRGRRLVPLAAAATICLALLGAVAFGALNHRRWSAHSVRGHEVPIPAETTAAAPAPSPPPALPAPLPDVPTPTPSTPMALPSPVRATAPAPIPAPTAARTVVDSDDMLRQANELRAQRRWAESLALYESIMRTFPGTPQAYSGGVSAAYLRLDHMGDARGALLLFQSLASRGGALSEEIDWGVARSYRALGDVPQEAKALEAFAAGHPDSPRIDAVRARLGEIQ